MVDRALTASELPIERACRACGTSSLVLAWDLVPSPYGDRFMESKDAAVKLPSIGLSLMLCSECSLLQLAQDADSIEIYGDYLYRSSVTVGLGTFYDRLAHSLIAELGIENAALIVDVGSNDGTGLIPFRDAGMRVVGIEPSNIPAQAATARGVPTVSSFLDEEAVAIVQIEHGPATLVCANYVAANVPDPLGFLRLMRSLLAPDGAISIVTGYHPDQFAVNMFEYVNHDHLTYLTVTSVSRIAELAGLRLTSARRAEHKGGSIHLLLRPIESESGPDESIPQMLQREAWMGIDSLAYHEETAERIGHIGTVVGDLLRQLNCSHLAGIGASISTTHLLHQFSIGHYFGRLFDDDPIKVGRFSPGFGIEVSDLDELGQGDWDTAVVLAWQHSTKLLSRLLETGFRGTALIPLPRPKLLHFG